MTRAHPTSALTTLRSDVPNWVYRYENPLQPGKWTQILSERIDGSQAYTLEEPQPRYAHQIVYDESTKTVYMYGGNAGAGDAIMDASTVSSTEPQDEGGERRTNGGRIASREKRLDDFWCMNLERWACVCIFENPYRLLRWLSPRISTGKIIRLGILEIRKQQ